MDLSRLAELAGYYEEYLHGDRKCVSCKQARFLYEKLIREQYSEQTELFRKDVSIEKYIALFVIPELDRFLEKRQSPYPTITPENPQKF
jgi:hypothetical protein